MTTGDAENRLIELGFGGGAGSPTERQAALLSAVFGSSAYEVIRAARDDGALAAASARARERLLAQKPALARGRRPYETLLVKAPFFASSGEREYMWIEVVSWEGKRIRGVLQSEPRDVPSLHAGARVEIDEGAVYDYLLERADGTQEGNETTRILQGR